jgi:hypothetical protein
MFYAEQRKSRKFSLNETTVTADVIHTTHAKEVYASRVSKGEQPMRALLPALLLASTTIGCANQQLRFSTLRQTSTLPDIQQKQVIENFARLAFNAGDMPYYAIADTGTAVVTVRRQ